MLGTKLLLLCFVVYVTGQGVSYHGSSNVRTQSRLPPRPLGPYRQPYQPIAEPIRPVYNPQPAYQPQPEQPAPVYHPPQLEQPSSNPQPNLPPQATYQQPQPVNQPPQPVYQPPQPVYQPPQPAYERPSERPAPEIPPQPIYQPIPPHPAIPSQPPRPIDIYPRPLPAWTWKPAHSTEAPLEIRTQEAPTTNIEAVYSEESSTLPPSEYIPKAAPAESVPELTPEGPIVVLQPDPTTVVLEEEPLTEPAPAPPVPETSPQEIPETPSIYPMSDAEQPTLSPNSLVPVAIIEPQPEPISYTGSYLTPRPIPRPLPTSGLVLSPKPTPEPVLEPIYPPAPEAPLESVPMRPVNSLPPIQPVLPPRPNYRPIPTALVPTQPPSPPQPVPMPPRPEYQPLQPPAPVNPIVPIRPLPPQPPAPRPTYEPFRPPTPYPTPVSSLAPVPTQPPTQPTSYPVVPTSIGPAPGEPDISLIIPVNNFECRNGNGYYKVMNECDAYIRCKSQRAFKYSCPDGLHFNPEALYPEYPCAYPSQVQCESTASKQIARPTNECPNRYGFFSISGGDCSKYTMCQEGKATLMNCPFGLVFNDQISSCDWPENVPQCNLNAFKDFTCPAPPGDDPDELTRHRYGSDCGMYVACQRGHPRLLKCDAGMSFDVNSQVCIDSDLVAECRVIVNHL